MAGIDPKFGVNAFEKGDYSNESQTVANNFLALLLGKPGFFPSMPELGIYIQSYVYQHFDDIDVGAIKAEVIRQCDELMDWVNDGSFDVIKTKNQKNGSPMILFKLPVQEKDITKHFAVAITMGDNNSISYNFTWLED